MTSPPDSDRTRFRALVDSELEKLERRDTRAKASKPPITAFHRAAAVISTFDSSLAPAGEAGPGDAITDVLADAEFIVRSDRLAFRLRPDVRRRVLTAMRTRAAMLAARRANPAVPDDGTQAMLDLYLEDAAPPLAQQSIAQLTASFEISPWLHGILAGVPPPAEVRARIELETLLSGFEDLVGTHFGGREKDLAVLHDYVGVLPPSTLIEGLWRNVREVASFHEKPPLVVYGPGGYGKSTLIARFILEYARLEDARRFPFVYLDYDRATIMADDPLTILNDAVRQLAVQYPQAQQPAEALRESWRRRIGRSGRSADQRGSTTRGSSPRARPERITFIKDFAAFLRRFDMGQRPLLLVLDTFEEVQRRSTAQVGDLWSFLGMLQQEVRRLRVVISGRAPVTGVNVDGRPLQMQLRELERLDVDASTAILQKQGMPADQARRIASRLGGSPLTLKLAAQLAVKLRSQETTAIDEEFDEDALAQAVADGEVERYLYTRILDHIALPAVKQLAHPGLVLRRVTPDLILQVLAEPCGLAIATDAEAVALFDELKKEVSLVAPADEPGTLRHRPELRRLMLRFMERTEAELVRDIHERAVSYYARAGGIDPVARAEEIYHRLACGESGAAVSTRWITGVDTYLYGALEDLPAAARSWLATRLHVELSEADREAATLGVWEIDAMRRARELSALGQLDAALGVLRERSARSPASPLFQVEADVLGAEGRVTEALAVLDTGIRSTFEAGNDALRVDLQIAAASLEVLSGRPHEAHRRLDDIEPLADARGDTLPLIALILARLDALYAQGSADDSEEAVALVDRLHDWCGRATDDELSSHPALARRVGAEVAKKDVTVLTRAVRLAGIGTPGPLQLRALGQALADWDRELAARDPAAESGSLGATPLSRLAHVDGATERSWQSFVLTAPLAAVDAACRRIVQEYTPPPHVARVFAHVLGDATPASASATATAAGTDERERRTLHLDPAQRLRAVEAILDAYPSRALLDEFVGRRFNRSLAVIASSNDTLRQAVVDLMDAAASEGWSARLLIGAYQSRRDHIELRQVLEESGLVASIGVLLPKFVSWDADWRGVAARLIEHEGRVCRVETDDGYSASGILVAPDIVMTVATGVVPRLEEQQAAIVRFDQFYHLEDLADGSTPHQLARNDWLIDFHLPEADALDVAFIRLAAPAAFEPVGSASRAAAAAPPRGFIPLVASSPDEAGPVLLLHYPKDGPLALVHANDVQRTGDASGELRYRASTPVGSAGSPILNRQMEPIGIHIGTMSGWRNIGVKRGVALDAIVEWARGRPKLMGLLRVASV